MQSPTMQMQSASKSAVLGFILEIIIPGLGFLYAGARFTKAALMFVGAAGCYVLAVIIGSLGGILMQNSMVLGLLIALVAFLVPIAFLVYREVKLRQFMRQFNQG
jgi:hypothetical protein